MGAQGLLALTGGVLARLLAARVVVILLRLAALLLALAAALALLLKAKILLNSELALLDLLRVLLSFLLRLFLKFVELTHHVLRSSVTGFCQADSKSRRLPSTP